MKHFLSIRVRTSAHLGSRLLTPEPVADYAYVNYHDTSNGRASLSKDEKGQPRSILKNKQVGSSLTHSSSHLVSPGLTSFECRWSTLTEFRASTWSSAAEATTPSADDTKAVPVWDRCARFVCCAPSILHSEAAGKRHFLVL